MACPLRILCTEDDADTRELIALVFRNHDVEVLTTESPDLAIEIAKDFSFDLYLVDNWMAGMSGPTLCKELRRFDDHTPILFYSAAGYETDKAAAYASGAQGYLVKPIGIDVLVSEALRLISESRAPRTPKKMRQAATSKTIQPAQYGVSS